MQIVKRIETKRLILNNWKRKDAEDLYQYAKNPNVGPHAGWKPHADLKESKFIIRHLFLENQVWAIRDKATGKAIGTIGFEPDKYRPSMKSKELGYSLSEDYWGKGLMTEAARAVIRHGFEAMNLDMISICTGPENKRSQRIISKCGFTYEGTLRRAYLIYDGTKRDVLCHSLMREEWQAAQSMDVEAEA
jgi:RimJ/RimL family protein N-acetyltransferase